LFGAEFFEFLCSEGLTVEEAIAIMKEAHEDGETWFLSNKLMRHTSYRYSYDVEAREDFDGTWMFYYKASA